jgi:hypothetical protein
MGRLIYCDHEDEWSLDPLERPRRYVCDRCPFSWQRLDAPCRLWCRRTSKCGAMGFEFVCQRHLLPIGGSGSESRNSPTSFRQDVEKPSRWFYGAVPMEVAQKRLDDLGDRIHSCFTLQRCSELGGWWRALRDEPATS